jgi:hypothetical protein
VRYLVVGTLPPPRVGRSAALLELVGRLEAEGHEVEVVSVGVGDPATRGAGLAAAAGVDTIWTLLRRRAGDTRLVVQVEPALIGAQAGRARRTAGLAALSLALSRWSEVEIRVDSFSDLPGGLGGRAAALLWRRATRIVVASEAQRELLCREAQLDSSMVAVEPWVDAAAAESSDWPADGEGLLLADIQSVVGRRAAAERMRSGHVAPDRASRMLESASGPGAKPAFGVFEPAVRFAYERPALREPLRVVARVARGARSALRP